MTSMRKLAILAAVLAAPFAALGVVQAQNAPASERDHIVLYGDTGFKGGSVKIMGPVENLQSISADGMDGTANDFAFSLRTQGRWQVCMDAGYVTRCRVVEGEVADLGDDGGSVSSILYVGPSLTTGTKTAGTSAGTDTTATATTATAPAAPATEPEWHPMYNTDFFGNDIREIIYGRPGSTWQSCKAACDADGQCQAWTYVQPGRQPYGECFLKAPVPEASESSCCISGVKGAPSSMPAGGAAMTAPVTGSAPSEPKKGKKKRGSQLGERVADAAEDELGNAAERGVREGIQEVLPF